MFCMSCLFCIIPFTMFIHPSDCIAGGIHVGIHEELPHDELFGVRPFSRRRYLKNCCKGFDVPDGGHRCDGLSFYIAFNHFLLSLDGVRLGRYIARAFSHNLHSKILCSLLPS